MEANHKDEFVQRLNEELASIKKSFEVLLLAIEAEGVLAATELAERLMGRVENLMVEVKKAYVDVIFEKRFRSFADDHKRLNEMKAAGGSSTDAFIEMVGRIEKHIISVDREMRLLLPKKFPLFIWFNRNWKKLAIGVVGVVVLFGVFSVGRQFMTRGKGLIGEYYDGTNFRKLVKKRRDIRIDFDLSSKSPIRGLGTDNYSVRWTGTLKVPSDGNFEFITRSDDGVRLWIDGEMLIDNWTVHRAAIDKNMKQLTAGPHSVKLEWFQRKGPAMMKLYWRTENDAQPSLIEPEYLAPAE